ncbi:MAG: hypothetical protein IT391_02075 [Nitrospira sp.]|nr:hypothetical protein [Nitrospira sp.]
MLLINPLHAVPPLVPQEASPYSPSSRRYLNPLYLRFCASKSYPAPRHSATSHHAWPHGSSPE